MTERLTDDRWRQELEWLRREPHAAIHQPNAIAIVKELLDLRARVEKLEAALSGLVYRLDEIHEDLAYKAVWTSYMLHGGRYQGPTYVDALAEARATLKDAPQ